MKFDVTVESRAGGGKGPARQLRRAGRVPAVLYGQGECLLLSVGPEDLVKILRTQAGSTALISITINGAKSKANRTALLRDYQIDPIAGTVLHADFFEVAMDKPIRVKVPVHLIGVEPPVIRHRPYDLLAILNELPELPGHEQFGKFCAELIKNGLIRNALQRIRRGKKSPFGRQVEGRERKRGKRLLLRGSRHGLCWDSLTANYFLLPPGSYFRPSSINGVAPLPLFYPAR